jgi:heat shock protein HtpX
VIRFALSRRREYLADAGSVELTKNPDAMISALRRIENRGELGGAPSAVMEMCVDNPRHGFTDLFATHPAVEQRVAALVQYAGGHDPGPLALPEPAGSETEQPAEGDGPRPFLPDRPPVDLGQPSDGPNSGPWGRPRDY